MSRTPGSKDKRKRKVRSDKGKPKKMYAGKPVKKKRRYKGFVKYVSTRKRDDPIKLWMVEIRPMNKDSYTNFSEKSRRFMRKITYTPRLRIDVPPMDISNKEKVEQLCINHLWVGHWLIRGFSRGRNRFHCKPVPLCEVVISEHKNGLKAKMVKNIRLYRYFFWEK